MKAGVFRSESCRLCRGKHLELVLELEPTPIAETYVPAAHLDEAQETYPLDLFFCLDCGHLQMLDVVDPEVLFGQYTYVTSSSLGLVEHFRSYRDDALARRNPAEGSLVVDIGSNDGTLLKFFLERNMRVIGVDPARNIARDATEAGIATIPSFFTAGLADQIRQKHGPAALITANNVFAHAHDLADMATGISRLLARDGLFMFEVSYLVDIVLKMLFDTIYHEHLSYHSVKPLDLFFRRHDLELIDIERLPSKGGSLRGTVQPVGGPGRPEPSVAELICLESNLGLDRPETFKKFAAKIEDKKARLGALLSDHAASGKSIAGYGFSPTVNTLIYHFGLGDILSFIVDDNQLKHNLFTPGHHIPLLSPQAIYDRKPEYIVVLAWNYAEPIIRKHQEFLRRGGQFIIPLPEIKVI